MSLLLAHSMFRLNTLATSSTTRQMTLTQTYPSMTNPYLSHAKGAHHKENHQYQNHLHLERIALRAQSEGLSEDEADQLTVNRWILTSQPCLTSSCDTQSGTCQVREFHLTRTGISCCTSFQTIQMILKYRLLYCIDPFVSI